ncbi:MAG: polysaccharide biosynthesis C-terminal domain-containing protein [Defluviitaleaceae bacterium]|nr:polysaccharide biosynthesis C-terminal domain-containing protein [Defluviitaleaceae bacterium]
MNPSENRSAADVAVISLAGRALTLLGRTMYLAMFGMANPLLNAFNYALNVPNVLFNVVGTAINTVMIPVYTSLLAEERRDEAKKFIDNIISISMVIIGMLVFAGILAAPMISDFVAGPGYEHAAYLTFTLRFLMPVMIFFGFSSIFQGLLQSNGIFRLPAFVSAPGGIVMILYLVFLGDRFGVTGLIFATALGLFLQPLIMVPAMYKLGYRYKFSFDLKNPHIKMAGKLSVPVLISVSSYQINFIFNHTVAFGFGTVAIMDYSQLLVQVFMLTIVYAIASVYFPKMSALWAKADSDGYMDSLRNSLLFTVFIVLPAALGFLLLRYEIMDFLLGWREHGYGSADIVMAGNLLGLFSIGIIAISMKEALDRAFYSTKDSKTPAFFGVLIMGISITSTLILLPRLGPYSMPVAYCISAFLGVLGLIFRLNHKVSFINRSLALNFAKILLAAVVMLLAAGFGRSLSFTGIRLINLLIPAIFGVIAYFAAAFALKIPTLLTIFKREA